MSLEKSLSDVITEKLRNPSHDLGYDGFDMSANNDSGRDLIFENNRKLLFRFKEYFWPTTFEDISKRLFCWKGTIYIQDKYSRQYEFSGWETHKIIEWLIINQEKIFENSVYETERIIKREKEFEESFLKEEEIEEEPEIFRKVSKSDRYNVLKRQNWNCNLCHIKLKYNKYSEWGEEVAHIDHIHTFVKKETYPNGKFNINEISNLQALCPSCNIKKSKGVN